ncbi:MAG: HetZ-related protein [Rivularia sp. T60_A2020_040]|nr:HetZ-related protein [Rivularia sp. T60_A2020_040]
MKTNFANLPESTSAVENEAVNLQPQGNNQDANNVLIQQIHQELESQVKATPETIQLIATRIAKEVERICEKSYRIQTSGQVKSWLFSLARHRLQKCLHYYQLGSRRGRVELHSTLGSMVYRHISLPGCQLGFDARYNLIEDFLQAFYIEAIKAFRRENELPQDYTPRTRLQLGEYMAFTEQYAKRRISLPGNANQQLIILRAQGFSRRLPQETTVDMEMALESAKSEDAEAYQRNSAVQQVRSQMVAQSNFDPAEEAERDRVISELINYLQIQGQSDCVDYLSLKLQDLSAPEIDRILGLTSRQRDYLQQRFKYHVEKFARTHNWQLVHQWLGATLEQKLGMSSTQWDAFVNQLSEQQRQMLELKSDKQNDQTIAKALKCTPKQLQKRWTKLLELAWSIRNNSGEIQAG